MRVVADTSPLLAAAHRDDQAHDLAKTLAAGLGRDLVVLDTVMVEVDYLLRARVGASTARAFLAALAAGEHTAAYLTPGLLSNAVAIDAQFADLGLGLVDASVMAYAERHDLPVLTFDFADFRAAPPKRGYWQLVVDEARYADAVG